MSEAQRLRLAHRAVMDRRTAPPDLQQQSALSFDSEQRLQLVRLIEMILDRAFGAMRNEDDVLDAGCYGLLHRVLNERLVDDRQHLLGQYLGRGQEARA